MLTENLLQQLLEFRRAREWEQFHRPKELASALAIEAAELLELFQWKSDGEVADALQGPLKKHVADEVADIVILLSYLCHDLGIGMDEAVQTKLAKNALKYPVEKVRGSARKYSEY